MKVLVFLLSFLLASSAFAEFFMPKIFSDNMVLQQDNPVKIWGKAAAKSQIKVEFAGQSVSAQADDEGKWNLHLKPLKASKENAVLKVYENGKEVKQINDVLVGEVWITGGQSNMQCTMMGSVNDEKTNAYAKQDYPYIRCFMQATDAAASLKQADSPEKSRWAKATVKEIPGFTAVGFVFAAELNKALDAPIGIISSAIGGSPMIIWGDEDVMINYPAFSAYVAKHKKTFAEYDYQKELAIWQEKYDAISKDDKKAQGEMMRRKPNPDAPYALVSKGFNAKIYPLAGYTLRGAIWYQGEADAFFGDEKGLGDKVYEAFSNKFASVVESWRKNFENADMPFYYVELASFDKDSRLSPSAWAITREAQRNSKKIIANVDGVSLADSGDKDDIHPRDKHVAGTRLALLALKKTYSKNVVCYGPEPITAKLKGGNLEISMNSNDSESVVAKQPLQGFEVRVNGQWQPIQPTLNGNVISAKVDPSSDMVRYLWMNHTKPNACIFNAHGLPMAGFRMKIEK